MLLKINKILSNKLFALIFLLLILINPINTIYKNRDKFFSRHYAKEYPALKSLYYSSQYAKKKNPVIIPDETFEAFAGGIFLRGLSPILIVHDHPPLGRYIVSLSILLFDNENTFTIPLFFASGCAVFLLGKFLLNKNAFALIPLAIFLNEPLMIEKLSTTPLGEVAQLPFILFTFYFFLKGVDSKNYIRWFVLVALGIGFVISIRFFITGVFMLISMILFFIFRRDFSKKFITFLLLQPLSLIILFLSYTVTIINGYSLIKILGVQKYILLYHKSAITNPLSFWDLLLFNNWHTWWGTRAILHDVNWNIIWPLSVVLIIVALFVTYLKRTKMVSPEILMLLWIVVYSLMLSVGYTSVRYFLPLLPFLYILATSAILKILNVFHVDVKNK